MRDYAQVRARRRDHASRSPQRRCARLEIDALGLDDVDYRVLRAIIEKFDGGPVGLETIAASISEDADTIMDVYEPYLLQLGFLQRTPRGRQATRLAYEHLGIDAAGGGAVAAAGAVRVTSTSSGGRSDVQSHATTSTN